MLKDNILELDSAHLALQENDTITFSVQINDGKGWEKVVVPLGPRGSHLIGSIFVKNGKIYLLDEEYNITNEEHLFETLRAKCAKVMLDENKPM